MKKYWPFVAVALIVVLVIGVLAMRQSNSPSSSSNDSTSSEVKITSENSAETNKISMSNLRYTPAKITVKQGTTVTWTNDDNTAHTVTGDSSKAPRSKSIEPGQSFSFKFDLIGIFGFNCDFHPDMKGTVTVNP